MDRAIAAITSAQALARALDARIGVAVVDGAGRCLGSARSEGSSWLIEDEARATARACASLGMDTSTIESLKSEPWMRGVLARQSELGTGGTGLLVEHDSTATAAVGVAGGSDEVDALCAERAAACLAPLGEQHRIDDDLFRQTMSRLLTGATAIMTVEPQTGHLRGMTANCVMSLSRKPPIVGIAVGERTQSYRSFASCRGFTVNVLHAGQMPIARQLARSGPEKFDGLVLDTSPGGLPVVPGSLTSFECLVTGTVQIGDHVLVCGEMVWSDGSAGADPLVFLGSDQFARVTTSLLNSPTETQTPEAHLSKGPQTQRAN